MRCEQRPVARRGLSIPGASEHVGAAARPAAARPPINGDEIRYLTISHKLDSLGT